MPVTLLQDTGILLSWVIVLFVRIDREHLIRYSPYNFHYVYAFQLQLCQYKNDINSLVWRITRLHAYLQNRHLWKNVGGVDHHLTPPLKTQAFVFSSFQSWWQFFWETDNNNMSRGKKNTTVLVPLQMFLALWLFLCTHLQMCNRTILFKQRSSLTMLLPIWKVLK